ncbi:hypothetical protein Rt10032_c08g3609 [Rhodotorula toruloides]|uniref:Proteasome assembly chaperone 1 n=1 Tax=Rhodotorula toruloides TaxID=5286 RepID=A0A511KGW4_RHOTO|nr:hypothetical protein Rt10032_c08g3609 [Rhodotorula toruloides]
MEFEGSQYPAPIPSYALESSSGESELDDDELAAHTRLSSSGRKALAPEPVVELRGPLERLQQGGEAVFLVGEAGERIAQGVEVGGDAIKVTVDGEQAGLIAVDASGAVLVFLSTALPLASLHPLASKIFDAMQPARSTILASYHLPSYIPPADAPSASSAPLLFLASPSPAASISKLRLEGLLRLFNPPNLLHGLPSALLTISVLSSASKSSTLLLLPTTAPHQPLNGPFSPVSPIKASAGASLYDSGGPTGLGDPSALFRELAGTGRRVSAAAGAGAIKAPLQAVKQALGWNWWDPTKQDGQGFAWLEKRRKELRREELSSMYM